MVDRILTYQQSSVMQDIELFLDMSKRGAEKPVLQKIWEGILDLVVEDHVLYPPELQPSNYFKGRIIFGDRVAPRIARVYLHRLHKHLDTLSSPHVRR